jgi:PAS domain S-box-containing protein
MDSSPDPIFVKDRAGRMLLANPATLATLQKPATDVLGKTDEELYADPAVGRQFMANDRHVIETGETLFVEEAVPGPGRPRVFFSAKVPHRDVRGSIIGLIGIARDITERKRAEEAVRDSELKYRRLHESITDAVVTVDMTGRILESNPAFEAMLGYTGDELRCLTYQQLTPERWHASEAEIVSMRRSIGAGTARCSQWSCADISCEMKTSSLQVCGQSFATFPSASERRRYCVTANGDSGHYSITASMRSY